MPKDDKWSELCWPSSQELGFILMQKTLHYLHNSSTPFNMDHNATLLLSSLGLTLHNYNKKQSFMRIF